jgi:receptor expression-enhancing protein 5/6
MPFFVSILRQAMLFLNIYDSYKVLKTPPVRHGGQPSQRALSQRKRDMKGCLAVWIVWVRLHLTSLGGRHLHLTVLFYDI